VIRAPRALALVVLLAGCLGPSEPRAGGPPDEGRSPDPDPPEAPPSEELRFAHEHAALAIIVDGQRANLRDPAYDLSRTRDVRAHMHVGEADGGSAVHVEAEFPGGIPNLTLAEVFSLLGMTLEGGRLALNPQAAHGPIERSDGERSTLRVFFRPMLPDGAFGPWTQIEDYPRWVPRHANRILVTFGEAAGEELERQLAEAMQPPIRPFNLGRFASPETQDGPLRPFAEA